MAHITPNLAIIGSGSGNSVITPFWDDKRVVIAESGVFGGTCLNVGCIPTKMFVRPATLARGPEEAARLGVTQHTDSVDWPAIRDRVFNRIDPISEAGERYRGEEQENVDLISQRVTLTGHRSFVAEDGTEVEAEQLVLAAGSRPVLPDIPGIELPQIHTSQTVMRLAELPRRIVIAGGGYVASEFAGIFSGLGSEVVQVVRGERLLRSQDSEISELFTAEAARHWELRLGSTIASFTEAEDGDVIAEVVNSVGETEFVQADIVLMAIGRIPNTDLLGAAEVGLDLHEDGRLVVDDFQRVYAGGEPVPGLFALGDISSPFQLKHVANHEARVVAHNVQHPENLRKSRQYAVPSAVFSYPELASVGLTEEDAIRGIGAENVTAHLQRYGDAAYGWAMEDQHGVFKVIADRRDGTILGAHVMGYQASVLIQPIVLAMSLRISAQSAARDQYWIHPALTEITENALLGLDLPVEVGAHL